MNTNSVMLNSKAGSWPVEGSDWLWVVLIDVHLGRRVPCWELNSEPKPFGAALDEARELWRGGWPTWLRRSDAVA